MKILILSNPANPHTIKWVKALDKKGFKIFVFGLSNYDKSVYENCKDVQAFSYGIDENLFIKSDGAFSKIVYLKALKKLKQIISEFKPQILHSHYATSYGLLGALSGFHPYIISAWGSDVYDFPKKSFLHRSILKYNLGNADKILSTSKVMAEEVQIYTGKEIIITPFGIDTEVFKPQETKSLFDHKDIVIGTVKTLEANYGIENLIRAFKIVKESNPLLLLKLLIVGTGSQELYLKKVVSELGLEKIATFTGFILPDDIPRYHNMITVPVFLSQHESFGVAVLEALACEKPVIVTNVDGFKEIVQDGINGIIVPVGDVEKTAAAIEKLIKDKNLRLDLGKKGREQVIEFYNWKNNILQMVKIYSDLLNPGN
ncbi:MAG: glycosyltransferase family 4 protein [Ignavibacteriales bacterium]|nr:MAG: glycosyltransferase family 4 protein [Ignavibacteriales bacterium]